MLAPRVRLQAGDPPDELAELAATPAGHFFLTPAWMRAVAASEPRLLPHVLRVDDEAGALAAACPFFVVRRCGVRRLYAGAWGTYGGIVGRDLEALAAARRAFTALARGPRTMLARVHDFDGCFAGEEGWSEVQETGLVLDLPADPQTLFRDAFTMQNRNKIRKAEKLGVTVRRASDRAALERYAELYAESAARWGIERPLPARFFLALAGTRHVDVGLAERDGEPLAALLNFTCGGQVMNWGNVSRRDAWGASPNNLLHWRAIEAACLDARGPRLYNFGGSAGLPGVETFKEAFGPRPYAYLRRERVAGWARALGVRPGGG
jgi:hypothetical protein